MATLDQLLVRSAFRKGADRSLEVGGGGDGWTPPEGWTLGPGSLHIADDGREIYVQALNGFGFEAADASDWLLNSMLSSDSMERFVITASGRMEWGNGTDPANVSLEYVDDHLEVNGQQVGLPAGWSTQGIALESNDAYVNLAAEGDEAFLEFGLMTDGQSSFLILPAGRMEWGDGTNPADLAAIRSSSGLKLFNPSNEDVYGALGANYFEMYDASGAGMNAFMEAEAFLVQVYGDTTGSGDFRFTGDGEIRLEEVGGSFIAKSPDGNAYKLVPPNGGGAATWVAV